MVVFEMNSVQPVIEYTLPKQEPYQEVKKEKDARISFVSQPASHYIVSPPEIQKSGDDQEIRMLTVVFRSTGDKTRDVLRLRRIHGIITSYPGSDRFGFHVFERGRGYLLEFPNFTAGICNEMLARIRPLVGVENIRIEVITFQ